MICQPDILPVAWGTAVLPQLSPKLLAWIFFLLTCSIAHLRFSILRGYFSLLFYFIFFHSTNCQGGPDKKDLLQCLPVGQVLSKFTHKRGSASFDLPNLTAPRLGLLSPACVRATWTQTCPRWMPTSALAFFSAMSVCAFFIISGLWTFTLFLASLTIHYSFFYILFSNCRCFVPGKIPRYLAFISPYFQKGNLTRF